MLLEVHCRLLSWDLESNVVGTFILNGFKMVKLSITNEDVIVTLIVDFALELRHYFILAVFVFLHGEICLVEAITLGFDFIIGIWLNVTKPNWSESEFRVLLRGSVRVASIWFVFLGLSKLLFSFKNFRQILQVPCLLIVVDTKEAWVAINMNHFSGYKTLSIVARQLDLLPVTEPVNCKWSFLLMSKESLNTGCHPALKRAHERTLMTMALTEQCHGHKNG